VNCGKSATPSTALPMKKEEKWGIVFYTEHKKAISKFRN